jgi:hypothetical protein
MQLPEVSPPWGPCLARRLALENRALIPALNCPTVALYHGLPILEALRGRRVVAQPHQYHPFSADFDDLERLAVQSTPCLFRDLCLVVQVLSDLERRNDVMVAQFSVLPCS